MMCTQLQMQVIDKSLPDKLLHSLSLIHTCCMSCPIRSTGP